MVLNRWILSHPTRVRGLKFFGFVVAQSQCASHPTRVRGLKSSTSQEIVTVLIVAPYTGAWIEILFYLLSPLPRPVAPYTGAWIEIQIRHRKMVTLWPSHPTRVRGLKSSSLLLPRYTATSHPTRVRGLKFLLNIISDNVVNVAPYTGAWIEIWKVKTENKVIMSHPTRVRGLKYRNYLRKIIGWVAPYTGAWIEIYLFSMS